jgi:hypothetical protein
MSILQLVKFTRPVIQTTGPTGPAGTIVIDFAGDIASSGVTPSGAAPTLLKVSTTALTPITSSSISGTKVTVTFSKGFDCGDVVVWLGV